MDATGGKQLSWVDTCSHTCANGCCLVTDMKQAGWDVHDASLYSKVRLAGLVGHEAFLCHS